MRAGYRRSSIARQLWKTTALTSLALALSGVAAYGDDAGLWQPQVRAIIGADNNGGNAALEGFIPIKQTAESVLFLDVRAKHDFKDAFGQDIGLGIRRIVNPDLMLGGYAYFNAESYGGTQFTGGTLGVEAITPNFDAHVNVFVPIKGDSTDHSTSSTLSMVSNQLIEQISVLDHRDYAAWGIEGEVGAKVPLNLPDKHSLRLDIGGYHFEDPHGDDGSVTGAKAGIEYEIGDVFGTGTSLTFTGEVRNDNRDDTQFAGSVRLNIPFNPGGGSDSTAAIGADPVYPVSEGLRKRVNERVRGDIGVRIQSQDKTGGTTTRVAINAATNAAFGKFYFADGGLAGAGTQADPTTLDDAVTKAGNGGFVVALGGNGNLTTGGVTLATGQTVIGGGESVTAKLFGGGTATFNLGGSDGTIQGTNVANPVITLGNGNTLNGITITGGGDGIFGNNATSTTLTNVTVTGAGGNGADFTGNSTNVSASNFTATGNGLDGLHIEGDGTYNFTGTTLLSGNQDDGLDITGKGTYSFAILNAQDNQDAGITVKGTAVGGSFTTTGGQVSGNTALGDDGAGIFIDPITAHVVLDSISQTGGTSGVVLDHVSGSFTVNGATTISNTTGPAIAISDSPATIRFGDINITALGGDGMSFSGVNAAVVAGNIVISGLGLGHAGLDFSGSQTTFTALSANISGSGAGSIGIDLADTTGGASIIITNGGTISGVDTGVRLGIAGSLAHSANAQFSFGGGSIAGVTASLDARGLNQTLGLYAFGSTTFSGPQLFDLQNVIFVGAAASGAGDGSSLANLASIGTADGITDANAIFVLVNDAGNTPINASGGFSLSDDQTLASFGNGRSFSLGGVPINVTGTNIQHDQVVSDPGTGAATLTNSGAGDVVTLGNGNSLLDFNISGSSGAAINGTGVAGLAVQGVTVSNVATGLSLDNFSGTGTFTNFDIASAGAGVSITGGTTGTLTFDAASSIAGTTGVAFNIDSSTPNLIYNGTINQTAAASAVKINAMNGGFARFGGKITASTGAANAIDLTGNASGAIAFVGGLDLTTDGGFAFSAVNGGNLTVYGASNTVATGLGPDEKGIQIAGMTIGLAGVNFSSVTVDGSGGGVSTGIAISNTSGGNVNFGGVDLYRISGVAISLDNVASGRYTFQGTTKVDTVVGGGSGFLVQNSAATVGVSNLVTTNIAGADVSLTNNTGTIDIGGTITNSGTGDGVVVSGGSAAITIGATINSSATAPGTAVRVDGITGGSVAFTGPVTSTGAGNLFAIGSTTAPTGGTISFTDSALTASGGGGAIIAGLGAAATFNATSPISITNAVGNGLSVSNVAGSATFGAVTVSGATGNGIDISGNSGSVTFGTTNVTLGSAANTAGINFGGINADVSFGTTSVTMGAGANQTAIDFSGSSTTADFGVTTITGTGEATSRGIDLSSTTGNKTITFLRGSSISDVHIGVDLSSGLSTLTSANANFTFGDGTSSDGLQSSISAAPGGYTVNTVGLDPTLGNYDFDDVFFTGSANLPSAVGAVTMVSQSGGVIAVGTYGLSQSVTTISLADADLMTGTQTFAFVGTVDLSATPFTLDSGQSITGFGNSNTIAVSGTFQQVNVQGNLGATGGNVTGDEGVVTGTADAMHLLGSNQVRNTAFDFTGASGSVFLIDQSAAGFDNTGGITIQGVTVSNVAVGQTAFKVDGLTSNVSIIDNNINVAGTLLDADGGDGNITLTRGNLPNGGPAGTLTGGGVSIVNRTGGLVDFTDKATIGGNGVSLANNSGAGITFADLDVSTNGTTAFTATGGGTITVDAGTINATDAQAASLDSITADIHFTSTSATFSAGNGIDLQNLAGTAAFGTGTLTNTGTGTAFNIGSATNASGGNATVSYGGTIASNGTGAAVSIQELTGGSVTLSGNLTDGLAGAGGNILIAGNDSATITFSGTTKQISSGATDGVNIGFPGGYPSGTPSPNTNSAINFTTGGLDITTTGGMGFAALGDFTSGSVTVTGSGNKINSGADGLVVFGANVGAGGITFDSIAAVSTDAGVLLQAAVLNGDVNIGGLRDTGYTGASLSGLTGTGAVNFTGDIDLDVSFRGFDIGGPQVGTINIANVAGSTLTIDGGEGGIVTTGLQSGIINVGGNGGVASIGATTSTTGSAIAVSGGNDLVHATLNYNGSIKVDTGSVVQAVTDWSELNLSGSVVSTTDAAAAGTAAFTFTGNANGAYNISSTTNHTGKGIGVLFDGSSEGTATFSGTSKIFNTSSGANGAIVKAPSIGPGEGTGTLAFTGGNLKITTSSGAGFTASTTGPGTVSVSGTGNTITTTTGTALDLDGATVGPDGVTFDSVSVNGAATGIALNNVSGGTVSLGAANLLGITSHGVDISGTLGSTLNFTSLNIGLGAANAIGLELNGAALGASTITAGDFDVDGGSFAGMIGIDMAGTTGTGTIQLGDTTNNNPAGQTSKIENVGYGVQFSNATNAKLVFGDGAGPAESSIATTGGQVIHATDSLPTSGDYNFNDVNFSGDTSNLSAISVYYVTADASALGDGSLLNPGTYANAQNSTANVIVLIDKNGTGSQETIDLGGTSFQLDDGQVLLAFKSGDAAVDVSQLGVDTSSGASGVFHFTTVQNSPIISAPSGIDTLRPILQSNTAASVVNFATAGTGVLTGGIENLIIRNTGSGTGVSGSVATASSFFLRNNDIAAGGRALDFITSGAPAADRLLLSIDGNTLQSTGTALAANFLGQSVSATQNTIAIRSFANNTVIGGTGGGIAFNGATFDSTGGGGTVSAGTLTVGTTGARVQGDGLNLLNTSGTLDLGTFSIANNGGTGLLVNEKGGTTFTLNSSGGSVDTTNGTAINLDPLTVHMTLGSVTATGGASGIIFDGVAGTFAVTGATSITGTSGAGISAINTNTGTFNFNTVTVNNTTGGGIGWASGTLNVTGLANIDTTTGAGIAATGGTISVAGSGNTITTGSGTALDLSGTTVGAGGVNFSSVSANGAATGIALNNVSGGAIALGTVDLQGITSRGIDVSGTLGAALSFTDLGIGLNSSSAVAFDLNGAIIDAAITANDFDVTNAAVGAGSSIGVDLRGATGGSTVRLGDAAVGGAFSSIAGTNTGIFLNSTTNLAFTYGDGESTTDKGSTVSANVGIDASSAPTLGTYNVQDVNFQASPGLGFGIGKIYFVGATATGDGLGKDQSNLMTLAAAEFQAGPNDILVLVNNGVITAAGGDNTLLLQAGEQVRGFGAGNINLALTVPSTIQLASNNVSIADQTSGGAATLTSSDGSSIVTLGSGGNIIDGFTINGSDGTGANAAIGISGATSGATISNMTIRNVTATDIDFGAGATGTTKLTNLSLFSTGVAGTAIKFGAASGTVTATKVVTSGGGGLSVVGGDAAFSFDDTSSVSSAAGTAVSITNRSGGSFGFAGTVTSSFGARAIFISGATGADTVSFTGAVNHNNATGAAVAINNGGQASTVSFANLTITTGSGTNTAFTATGNGTVNVATGSISTTAAQAINLNGIAAGINFTSTTSGGGPNNVALTNVTGTVNLGTGSLTGASGTAFSVSGGSANITYAGTIAQAMAGQQLIAVANTTGGTVNFTTAVANGLNDTAGTGILIDGAAGNVTVNNASLTGTAGITILGDAANNATGTYTFNNVAIQTAAGATNTAFVVDGDQGTPANDDVSATVNLNNVDITNPGGNVANIRGMAGGSVNFDSASSIARNDGGLGIVALSNAGGSINFGGASKTLSTGANAAVILTANSGATINFTGGGLAITTSSGQGFNATGGGTVSVTGSGNTISAGSGAAVNLDTVAVGVGGMSFASTNAGGGGGSAVILDTVTGPGAINLGTGALLGGNLAAIRIGDGAGGANSGGTVAFSYAGTITSGTGQAVNIQDRAAGAGNITLSGTITHNVAGQTGILLDDNAAGTITFSGTSKSITSGSAAGVSLTDNAGAIIDFSNGGLVISTTSGTGFNATGAGPAATTGGTVTVTGSGNTITSTTGTALNIVNTTIGAGNVTFQRISATTSSANAGIVLDNTGAAGGLKVTGTGAVASGGTIANKTGGDILNGNTASGNTASGSAGTGIFLRNTSGASFTNMQLNDFSNFAVYGNNVTGFILANSVVSGVNGSNNNGNIEESAIRFDNLLGTGSITGSNISGGYYGNVAVWNTSGTLNRLTMSGNTFGLINAGGGNDNVDFTVYNSATANVTLDNNTFSGTRSDFFEAIANNNATMDVVATNNTFHNGQSIIPGGGTAISVRSGSGGNVSAATTTFNITNNLNSDGGANAFDTVGIFVAKGQDLGTMTGKIVGNTLVAKTGSNSDGIFVRAAGGGALTTLIQNNTITGWGNNGIHLQNNDGSATMNATVYGNSVTAPGVAFAFAGFFADNGATVGPPADTSKMNLVLGGTGAQQNTFTGGSINVSLSNFNAGTTFNLSTNGSGSGSVTGVVQDDNAGSPTVDTSGGGGTINLVGTLPPAPP
ncbi:hypothetical protein LB531_02830 [Mesorhizobium sp. CO1-1-2]|uniref:hypothetical protein n=1 Tax=Mesorhizobium sp. CO1-1-2 TaxID=2876635 RepID=UPI001CC92CD7|nr:hypothetical protein [Mesorhizobium sp. CO1-1-2]MBZ9679588.1 hypothetical protein [Mesorhizobium sp. CO1-1-2]